MALFLLFFWTCMHSNSKILGTPLPLQPLEMLGNIQEYWNAANLKENRL